MSEQEKVIIASRASVAAGLNPITAFNGSSSEAIVADQLYDSIVENALSLFHWSFAIKQQRLELSNAAPASRWQRAYSEPSDMIELRGVIVNDMPIVFDRYGGYIFTDTSTEDVVFAEYTYRAAEAEWPAHFKMAVQHRISAALAMSVTMKADMASGFDQMANAQFALARNRDSQSRTAGSKRKLITSRLISNRW
jgi:hypothetical protein